MVANYHAEIVHTELVLIQLIHDKMENFYAV